MMYFCYVARKNKSGFFCFHLFTENQTIFNLKDSTSQLQIFLLANRKELSKRTIGFPQTNVILKHFSLTLITNMMTNCQKG